MITRNDTEDWRETYNAYVADFKTSAKTISDEVLLAIRLKRLGYTATRLDDELRYIKGL